MWLQRGKKLRNVFKSFWHKFFVWMNLFPWKGVMVHTSAAVGSEERERTHTGTS